MRGVIKFVSNLSEEFYVPTNLFLEGEVDEYSF